jgi:hypothetical protein
MKKLGALLLACSLWAVAWAQDAGAPQKSASAEAPSADVAGDAATTLTAQDLLERSHLIAQDLSAQDRVLVLKDLASAAKLVPPEKARAWTEELFQAARDLPEERRRVIQGRALSSLAQSDPEAALALLPQMEAGPPPSAQLPMNPRAAAANQVFEALWRKKGAAAYDLIRQEAQRLGESGDYPFQAMGQIIRQLGAREAERGQALFSDALGSYQNQSPSFAGDVSFEAMLRPLAGVLPRPLLVRGYRALVERLLEATPPDSSVSLQLSTDKGTTEFRNLVDLHLWQILPVVQSVDTDLAGEIVSNNAAVARAQQLVTGAKWRNMVNNRPPSAPDQGLMAMQNRAQIVGAIASDSGESIEQAITDPGERAVAVAQAAERVADSDPARAEKLLQRAQQLSAGVEDKAMQLRTLVATGEAADTLDKSAVLRDVLERAFPLAQEVLRAQMDSKDGNFSGTVAELGRLTRAGMRVAPEMTVAAIDQISLPLVRAFLLVEAAQGLPVPEVKKAPSRKPRAGPSQAPQP